MSQYLVLKYDTTQYRSTARSSRPILCRIVCSVFISLAPTQGDINSNCTRFIDNDVDECNYTENLIIIMLSSSSNAKIFKVGCVFLCIAYYFIIMPVILNQLMFAEVYSRKSDEFTELQPIPRARRGRDQSERPCSTIPIRCDSCGRPES